MYKAVFFDFDGTLANDLNLFVKAYDFAFSKYGLRLKDEEIARKCFNKTEEEIASTFNLPSGEEFRKYYFEGIEKNFINIPLFIGVIDILKYLQKNKIKLGVITFAKRWYIDSRLKETGIADFFQSVISFNDVTNPKPHPEAVLTSCKNLGVNPEDSLLIGDARNDILMGKSAGCKTALFLPNENKEYYDLAVLKETNPDYIFSSFLDTKNIFYD